MDYKHGSEVMYYITGAVQKRASEIEKSRLSSGFLEMSQIVGLYNKINA